MSAVVGIFEAKTHLSELLERVEGGEEITIARRGRIIARLVPAEGRRQEDISRAVDGLRSFAAGRRLGNLSWKSLRDAGRKW